ncbi:MAG: HAD-IIIA family hydrolase [Phycisphaerae bacterium]|nr:HAD-IIIA family hydrolase [Phycisphaerae bacterium]
MTPRPAVFLDRDDTLIECRALPAPPPPAAHGDLTDPDLVRLLPGVLDGCASLRKAGLALVVITNQGVVARGGASPADVERIHDRVRHALSVNGGCLIDGIYYCPFHPRGLVPEYTKEHSWRKPAPGMILTAATELSLDLSRSYLIGDAPRDIAAGEAAGLKGRCILIGTDCTFTQAVTQILSQTAHPTTSGLSPARSPPRGTAL